MRHRSTIAAALVATLLPATVTVAAPDAAELVARLAREAPSSIAFVEVRFSSLLVEPLVVSGELDYESSTTLRRRVETPYRETTTISGETVRVERDGELAHVRVAPRAGAARIADGHAWPPRRRQPRP